MKTQNIVETLFFRLISLVCPDAKFEAVFVGRKAAVGDKESKPWSRVVPVESGKDLRWYVEAGCKRPEDGDGAMIRGAAMLKHKMTSGEKKPGPVPEDILAEVGKMWLTIRPESFTDDVQFLILANKAPQKAALVTLTLSLGGSAFKVRVTPKELENIGTLQTLLRDGVSVAVANKSVETDAEAIAA